jgi:hypothetical protein
MRLQGGRKASGWIFLMASEATEAAEVVGIELGEAVDGEDEGLGVVGDGLRRNTV